MENPFKPEDKVITKVVGKEVEATVLSTWKNEVQVRTPDNERRWRTIYTVWKDGESPLARPVKPVTARPTASPEEPVQTRKARRKAAKRRSKRRKR